MVFMRQISVFLNRAYYDNKLLLISIFIVSVLCSLIFLSFFRNIGPAEHRVPASDYIYLYEPVANNILQGKGITLEGKVPFIAGLGYPVILSGIFKLAQLTGIDKLDLIVAFNVIFAALAAVFLFFLASEIFNKKIGLLTSLLWMSYPFNLWLLKNPNTEMPFLPLLFAGLWLYALALSLVRGQRGLVEAQRRQTSNGVEKRSFKFIFMAGLILGLASFVRLMSLFLPLFLAFLTPFLLKDVPKRKKFLLVALLLAGNLLAILPWAIYSFSESGGFLFLSSQGPKSIATGITWLTSPGVSEVLSEDTRALVERAKAADLGTFSSLAGFFVQELIKNPVPILKLVGLKLGRSWYATSTRWYETQILAVQFLYLASGFWGLIYTIKKQKNKIRDIIFLSSVVFYFWGIAFITVSILRYMLPAMALVIIFSAAVINIVINKLWRPSFQ